MKILTVFFILLPGLVIGQSISRQVISSTGSVSGETISSSTSGPSILFTSSLADTLLLTQGFQQPSGSMIMVELIITPATCFSPQGGAVEFLITGCTGEYEIIWENQSSESLVENLSEGSYPFSITSGECSYSGTANIGFSNDCGELIPNVITLNNDGANDTWIVPELYLTENKQNNVTILNRWAQVVWEGVNYDNINVVWKGDNTAGNSLPSGTYFYRIESNSTEKTGYIELFK